MKAVIGLLVPVFVLALGVQHAGATAFDFTTLNGGVEGSLGTTSVTNGGVTATGWQTVTSAGPFTTANLNLWLRNQGGDHGLGVCTAAEAAGCTFLGDLNELSNEST